MSDNGRKSTVLVVDDTPENIDLVDGILNRDYKINGVLSASVCWAKKLFKASSQRQGGRVSGVHPAVQDRSKISWV